MNEGGLTPRTTLLGCIMTGVMLSALFVLALPAQELRPEHQYIMRAQERIHFPHVQGILYHLTASCMGVPDRFAGIEWYEASAIVNLTQKRFAAGLYLVMADGRRLIILDSEYIADPSTITHESIHDLTGLHDTDPLLEPIRLKCEYGYQGG